MNFACDDTVTSITAAPTWPIRPTVKGTDALPDLNAVLFASSNTSTIKKVNAAHVLFAIEPDKAHAIQQIVQASQVNSDANTSKDLYELATKLVKHCSEKDAQNCKDALKKTN